MSKKFYETDKFKQEQEEWYSKLKHVGFKDIEFKWEEEAGFCKKQVFDASTMRSEYYDRCLTLVTEKAGDKTIFRTPEELKIYADHAKGLNLRQIRETLVKQISLVAIWKTIQRINGRAGLKI
jgi:hypothetical protein